MILEIVLLHILQLSAIKGWGGGTERRETCLSKGVRTAPPVLLTRLPGLDPQDPKGKAVGPPPQPKESRWRVGPLQA